MRITGARLRREDLPLSRPYRVAGRTTEAVEAMVLVLTTDGGDVGLGAATPEPEITGETPDACERALADGALGWLDGAEPRRLGALCEEAARRMRGVPGALAAVDMALHDLFARDLRVPLADALGHVHSDLPTSVTVGIQPGDDAIALADELVGRGFRILKVKIGESLDEDLSLLARLRERFGFDVTLRVDANAGYGVEEAIAFFERAAPLRLELVEQPVGPGEGGLRRLPVRLREKVAADESVHDEKDALALAASPPACGIFNVKLMKSGGIRPALRIGSIAGAAGISLMWGCMDESVIGISAALHAALACPSTRYLDLDGSFDLARDVARGGFRQENGRMSLTSEPGLGVTLL
ncbi:MAG TPA: dipeptide epimerase [Thermoanaerobaculia bacterium]|nr:dipeptide epimerase [Thermoanaerobaculia bacterium]